jgi:hypothetical protein
MGALFASTPSHADSVLPLRIMTSKAAISSGERARPPGPYAAPLELADTL